MKSTHNKQNIGYEYEFENHRNKKIKQKVTLFC